MDYLYSYINDKIINMFLSYDDYLLFMNNNNLKDHIVQNKNKNNKMGLRKFNTLLKKIINMDNIESVLFLNTNISGDIFNIYQLQILNSIINSKCKKCIFNKDMSSSEHIYDRPPHYKIYEEIGIGSNKMQNIFGNINEHKETNTVNSGMINSNRNDNVNDDVNMVTIYCPHCGHSRIKSDQEYIICGYTSSGYDWHGCNRDWCGICCKKLCKKWDEDNLFLPINRYHDGNCCKIHSEKTNCSYIDEYCQCSKNNFVKRLA